MNQEILEALPQNVISFPHLGIQFQVVSEAFEIFGMSVKWYGVIIAAGMLLAMIYGFRRIDKFGLDGDRVIDAVFAGIVGGIVCARLYYVIFNPSNFKTIGDVVNIRNGGLAIFGGIIGAVTFGCIVAKIRKVKILPLLDIASAGFFIGQGLGRWGNFFNHEAFGCNTDLPWGMSSGKIQWYLQNHAQEIFERSGVTVDPYLPVHPTFLYESIWCLLGFLMLHLYYKKRKYDGEMALMYLAWYGFERMIVEGLRTDSLYIGSFRVSQLLAGCIFLFAVVMLIVMRIRIKKNPRVLYVDTEESKELLRLAEENYKKEEERRQAKRNNKKGTELDNTQKIIPDEIVEDENTETEENE